MKHLVFWRTAIVVLLLGLMTLAALFMCAHWHLGQEFFQHAKEAFVGLATVAVLHSGVQHLADGGGLAGAAKALFTSAKPDGAPPGGQP
jgi:hypothetical protein